MLTLGALGGRFGSFTQFYLFLTLQHSWIPGYSTAFFANGVSWSISVEWFFYIMFPFLIIRRARTIVMVAMLWTAAVYGFMAFVSWNPGLIPFTPVSTQLMAPGVTEASFFHIFPPIRFVEFLSGMLVYQLYRRVKIPDNLVFPAQIACVGVLLAYMINYISILTLGAAWLPTIIARNQGHYGMFPLFALIVYVFAHQRGPLSSALSVRPLVYLGEISFSLYMIHQIIISNFILNTDLKANLGPTMSILLAFIISIAASSLLFHAIERPSLAFAKRRLNAGRTRSTPAAVAPAR